MDLDFWAGPGVCMHEQLVQICMHDILHTSPRKMTFVSDRKSAGYKGHCCAVMLLTSYNIRACPCKSSDVISLKYTDISGVF